MREDVRADTPPDQRSLKIKNRKKMSPGIPAINSSSKHGFQHIGLKRSVKTLTMINWQSVFEGETHHSEGWLAVSYEIPRKNIATYFPEANLLVPLNSTATVSNTSTSKWIEVTLESESSLPKGDEEE